MLISPERWTRSRFALRSDRVAELDLRKRWVRIQVRLTGLLGSVFVIVYKVLFFRHWIR